MARPLVPPPGRLPKLAVRQTVGTATVVCAPGVTDTNLKSCSQLNDVLDRCNTLSEQRAPKQDIINCFCTQEVFSGYLGCKNDVRRCSLSNDKDGAFDQLISEWRDACSPYLTATSLTTPAEVPLTQTIDAARCQALLVSCNNLYETFSSCSSSFTRATDLSSCRCGRDVLSLASECQINGAVECERTTPDPGTLWAARFCSSTPATPGNDSPGTTTMPLSTTTSTRLLPPGSTTSTPITTPPSISFGPGSTTTSSTTSAVDASLQPPGLLVILAWGIFITWLTI